MSVHYKFKSSLDYDTVTFDGLHISVGDLKKAIIQQKRIGKNTDFDLQVTNAQTKEVYSDESALIAKNTSLIIARVPLAAQPNKGRGVWNENSGSGGFATRTAEDVVSAPLSKAVDLSRLDASEEDKIRAMMTQSTLDYDPSNYMKIRGANQMGEVPANYRCYKCHQPGHWIKNCPLGMTQEAVEIKKSTGIPRSFMVPVEGPMVPGAMMTPTGQYAVPALDHQAYNSDGGGRGAVESEQRPDIPEDLVCSICKDLLTDAVMIPCCGNSFCDECIRTTLLESEDHECPDCHEKDISPGTLIPNRFLRNSVSNFRNETGYRKRQQYRHAINKPHPESTTEEVPIKPPAPITLSDFVPPPSEEAPPVTPVAPTPPMDQKPVISEADSTEQTSKQPMANVVEELKIVQQPSPKSEGNIPIKQKTDPAFKSEASTVVKTEPGIPISSLAVAPVPQGQAITSVSSGVVQHKVSTGQSILGRPAVDALPRPTQYRSGGGGGTVLPPAIVQNVPPLFLPTPSAATEERPGTPTIDEPGNGVVPQPHTVPSYPPGDTPPFMSPPDLTGNPPVVSTVVRPPSIPPPHPTYPQHSGYPTAPVTIVPASYPPPYAPPPRGPPPTAPGPDYNPHTRPFLPRLPYDPVRPPIGPYDPARPPPPVYPTGYPPRLGMNIGGPRPYGIPPLRNPPPNNERVIDDPLAAFERMLREKDERDRRVRESRRSRSRSYSPRSRRTRSSSRSRSYTPRSRSPRSRSPLPKPKLRNRSRTPRSISRSRSRSRGPVLRRSRSRDRSFSLSRSRTYSRSPSPREFSPRRRAVSRNRYRSPLPRNSPPRYRYPDRRAGGGGERDRAYPQRGGGRDREYGSYYDGPPPNSEYGERERDRMRGGDRDKEFERERPLDRRLPGAGGGGGGGSSRGPPRSAPPNARYLPSPTIRKDYPLGIIPQNQPTYYSVQEHAVYHHQNPPPNRYQGAASSGRMSTYPPALMSVKTVIGGPLEGVGGGGGGGGRHYDPPAPPGTEQPTVPGFESPRLMRYERPPPLCDAPPGVDPHAPDTVLAKPLPEPDRGTKDAIPTSSSMRPSRDAGGVAGQRGDPHDKRSDRDRNRLHDHARDRDRRDRKTATSPPDWKYNQTSSSPVHQNAAGPAGREHAKTPDKHHHRHKYETPERDKRTVAESEKRTKDSSEDDKGKNRSKDKKKRKKEKEAEKSKKKEERKKRKEQEKLKKAEEKKIKSETDGGGNQSKEKDATLAPALIAEVPPKSINHGDSAKNQDKADDLYSDVMSDGIDTKVVENYGKLHSAEEAVASKDDPPPENNSNNAQDMPDEKETPAFDGLDLHVSESDILKSDVEPKSKDKEVLAPIPVLSKWEVEEDVVTHNDKKEDSDDKIDSKDIFEKCSTKMVTSEVLKHAENAIFKKAINAIRPIEIKKISLDRAKLYSGEKHVDAGSLSPRRSSEKELIAPSSIQVTIPTSDWEMRLVDINPSLPSGSEARKSERELTSAVQKPTTTRLSVRERLGSKVDELDKITKDDRPYDRNRSRTLSPLSRRERDETNRNTSELSTRRVVEIDDRRKPPTSKHESTVWRSRSEHDRKVSTKTDRSRSRERGGGHREVRRVEGRGGGPSYRHDGPRRTTDDRRDRRDHDRHEHDRHDHDRHEASSRGAPAKKLERRTVSRDDRPRDDPKHKEKDRKVTKRSRTRTVSRDKGTDKNKVKKKDKKHKKEKEKSKKHRKDNESETRGDCSKRGDYPSPPEKEKKSSSSSADVKDATAAPTEKKITERRKPTLDESNFEPDYDALETESESEERAKAGKKRDHTKSPPDLAPSPPKKRKTDEVIAKKVAKPKEPSSSSESSSESSSSEEEKHKKKHKKHKKRKVSKKFSSSSSSDSDTNSSSDDDSKKKKTKAKKHKSSKKTVKKKKKSKHK